MLYTLISQKPSAAANVPIVAAPSAADINSITAVRRVLQKTARTGRHKVHGVASLTEISEFLRKQHLKPGDHIQIVGHARSGRLELGNFWTGKEVHNGLVYVITANVARNIAMARALKPGVKVWLIGCAVAQEPIDSEADGPSLLFDLAREWSCPVSGTVDFVGPDHFGSDGRYRFEKRLVTAVGRTVTRQLQPLKIPTLKQTTTLPRLVKLIRMTYLGRRDSPELRRKVTRAWQAQFGANLMIRRCRPNFLPIGLPEITAILGDGSIATFSSRAAIIHITRHLKGGKISRQYFTPVDCEQFQHALEVMLARLD